MLRDLRLQSDMTVEEIAKAVGISERMYYYLETGTKGFSEKTATALATLFKVSIEEVVQREPTH